MNDSELALAALLGELGSASGYGLASVARARGMERWAGLSPSSVYKGLRRLGAQRVARSAPDRAKTGRGPVGRSFTLTDAGARATRRELAAALAEAPEQSVRFRLALAFVDGVGAGVAVERLRERSRALEDRRRAVARARAGDPGARASVGATLVFTYVQSALVHERVVTARLIRTLQKWSAS